MSNETDLDWLARNVHYWGLNTDLCLVYRDHKGQYQYEFIVISGFTKDRWLARRTELQNKPSWNDAPEWANWLCQRDDGMWFWCIEEPRVSENGWETRHEARAAYPSGDQIPEHVLGDWRDTLERRPGDLSEPSVTARLTEATDNALAAMPELMSDKYKFDPLTSIEDSKEQGVKQDNGWFERGELPPAGVECEFRHPVFGWTGCDIVGHYRLHAVCAPNGGEFYGGRVGDFRPIRTEREAAVSEMMAVAAANWGNLAGCCEALYDAGYRKGEK